MDPLVNLNNDVLKWLLDPGEPGVRYLALRDVLKYKPDDPELIQARKEAHLHGPISIILEAMEPEGYWAKAGPGYNPKYRSTVWSIILLAQLGARANDDKRINQACKYLLDRSLAASGQLTYNGLPSGTFDCLQGNLCWAMLALGFEDPRLVQVFDWMARSETGDGIANAGDRTAIEHYNSVKTGPNFGCGANSQLPCAWGAAKVMLAFSILPQAKLTPQIKRAIQTGLDFLFSVDLIKATWPSRDQNRPSRNWWKFGFPVFYVTDLLQVAESLIGLGYGSDPRMTGLISFIHSKQNSQGRWNLEYEYARKSWVDFGEKGKPNKWVTLRALKVVNSVSEASFKVD